MIIKARRINGGGASFRMEHTDHGDGVSEFKFLGKTLRNEVDMTKAPAGKSLRYRMAEDNSFLAKHDIEIDPASFESAA